MYPKMNDNVQKVHPFDSFSAVYKILGWAGYYRPLNNTTSGYQRVFHQIYRKLAFMIVVIYNVQHLIFTAQNRHDYDKLMDCLRVEIPHLNLVVKVASAIYQTSRIDRLNSFLKEDITFRATDEEGQLILQKNKEEMHRLCRVLMIGVAITGIVWPGSFLARRYSDPEETVPSYMPFATDTWAKFILSVFVESGPILWVGFGHIALDVLVPTYYAHAQTQLKVIKQQLEHFVTKEGKKWETRVYLKNHYHYKDLIDVNVGKRFVSIVRRYDKVIWYKNEIDAIFNFSLSIQFFSSTATVCVVIYSLTVVSVTSFPFLFLVLLFFVLLTQVFLYCYYGNLVEFESLSINNSLYNCDWPSLSPPFRRQMLIAMIRWSQPIKPRVCYIIPLSLTTFITIVKSSYTLYTVLVTAQLKDA